MTLARPIAHCLIVLVLAVCPAAAQQPVRGQAGSSSASPFAPAAAGGETQPPETSPAQLQVFRLKYAHSAAATDLLKQIFKGQRVTVALDESTNSVLVHGSPVSIAEIAGILEKLDVPPPANLAAATGTPNEFIQMLRGGSSRGGGSSSGEDLSAAKVQSLRSDYEKLDFKAAQLADEHRKRAAAPGPGRKPEDLLSELRSVVVAAFGARQELQRAELALLRQRMTHLEQSVAAREQLKDKIVEQRVQDLLKSELRWEPAAASSGGAVPGKRQSLSPLSGVPAAEGSEQGANPPLAAPQGLSWPSTLPSGTVVLRSADEFSRKLQEAEANVEHVLNPKSRRMEDPKALPAARRQLQSIRDEYQAQLRLLQLELENAKLAFESAAKEQKRATQLSQQNIISSSELDRLKIAEGQARLRLQQLETLYGLYRKAGEPAKEAPGGTITELPAVDPRQQTVNNLKALLLAMHEYNDQHKRFPPAVILGKDGKGTVPHSWRVELLPRLGEQALYDQYRFDEPWDSAHNKQLLAKMPAVFRSPLDAADSTHASYFGVVWPARAPRLPGGGEGGSLGGQIADGEHVPAYSTVFSRPKGARMLEIQDGTSYTISLVEAKRMIPWTEPRDIVWFPSPDEPQPPLGGWYPEGFHAGFADGTVQFLSAANDAATLRALFTISGAEPVKPKLVVEPVRAQE